jgi:cytoskeleton protein RodZ
MSSPVSVGTYLRQRREARGVSLKEMARSTRVRERYLEVLEADNFAELPAVVFTKGFIRAYCQILNEPPDEALRLYSEQTGAPVTVGDSPRLASPLERAGRGREPIVISLVLLIVLGVALFGLTFALQGRSRQTASPDRRESTRPVVASEPLAQPLRPAPPVPAPTPSGALPATPSATAAPKSPALTAPVPPRPVVTAAARYRLVARVKEKTWVRVRTEDGRVTEETMSPGDVREWVSNQRFVLTVGNAGGLALELNGQPLPPLGPSGTVIPQIVIPPDRQ